jgi:death-on-curing protein
MILALEEALAIHELQISVFGGSPGLRDQGLLEAALSRPLQTFDGSELYPSLEEKAAALLESIVVNHPFLMGKKAWVCIDEISVNGGWKRYQGVSGRKI